MPVVYEHAARFLNMSPWEVSRDAGLLADAHIAAYRMYHHSPVTVGIDIYNLEPEAYGSRVDKPDFIEVPAIKNALLSDIDDIRELPCLDIKTSGRWPLVIKAAKQIRKELPEADIRLPLSGAYSIAGNLTGFETLLMASLTDSEKVKDALYYLSENQVKVAEQIIDEGFGISLFESAATPPLLSPALFKGLIVPSLSILTSGLYEKTGNSPACILGGDNAVIAEHLGEIGAGFLICPAETNQEMFLERTKKLDIPIRVNMSVEVLMSGDWNAVQGEIGRVKKLLHRYPFTLAGSGILPYNFDPELVLRISKEFSM